MQTFYAGHALNITAPAPAFDLKGFHWDTVDEKTLNAESAHRGAEDFRPGRAAAVFTDGGVEFWAVELAACECGDGGASGLAGVSDDLILIIRFVFVEATYASSNVYVCRS